MAGIEGCREGARVALVALTRAVPASIDRCELTHLERSGIDAEFAATQHGLYELAVESLGCTVQRLPPEHELPDSVFVEDIVVVVDECAVIARPGAESRRPEVASVAEALRAYRELRFIEAPGTLDGGDVLRLGRSVFVGLSSRTNSEGATQLRHLLGGFGFTVERVSVRDCLHLKTAVTAVADDLLLLNPRWIDAGDFGTAELNWIAVDPGEHFAANVLRIGETLLCSAAAERTRERLESLGFRVETVDMSELAKAEAGVTCCSVIVPT